MERETIIYRIVDLNEVGYIITQLSEAGIRYKNVYLYEGRIETENVTIRFVTVPIGVPNMLYVRGLKAVGCYGFSDQAEEYITNGHNVCKGYSLIDYILERNKCYESMHATLEDNQAFDDFIKNINNKI